MFQIALVLARELANASLNFKLPLVQNGYTIADRLDFAQFVRREENRPAFVLETLNDLSDFHAANGVQPARGLVENEEIRIID